MPAFVLEIGTEEMPARFLPRLQQELAERMGRALDEARVDHGEVRTVATPRRLAVLVEDVAPLQRESEEVVSGPPMRVAYDADGNPTKAAEGFARTQGVDLSQAFTLETDKGQYLAVRKKSGGGASLDLLPAVCSETMGALPFPKKMRWGSLDFTFGRPVRWLLALLGTEVVDFQVANIRSGRSTVGHRVMGPGPHDVADASDYLEVVRSKGRVEPDPEARRRAIREQGQALAAQAGGAAVWNEALLDEVSGLVEFPQVVLGDFDPSYLEVPREVLLTSMESHQKSFGVEDASGNLLPHFLCTLNLEPRNLELVRKGWERVLKARLEDARFFWHTDLKQDLVEWLESLENVVFLGPLGSMGDKARRLEKLCTHLAEAVRPELARDLARAGRLAKTDLVSEMVGEFAELQGQMGGLYAARKGESETVAMAIYEQYLPTGQDSPVPATDAGALLAAADKADTLAGCFGLNMVPTGANDPYALRRSALGICRIVLEKGFRLDLENLLAEAFDGYGKVEWKLSRQEALGKLRDFFAQRLKALLTTQGHGTLVVEAALGAGISDIWALSARVEALSEFSRQPDFEQAVLTFKRAANIIRKQAAEQTLDGRYRQDLLREEQEKALAKALEEMIPRFDALWAEDGYAELMGLLRELRPSVDAFFDHVMVMCDEGDLRLNRLNLLQALVERLGRLADFNALQV